MAQLVKNTPAMQETWVQSLGWEDPLEKGKATHSSVLAWRIPWTVQSMGSQRVGHHWVTFTLTFLTLPPLWLLRNPSSKSNYYHQLFKSTASCMYMLLLLSWGLRINHWLLPFRWWLSYQNKPNQIYKNTKCIRDGKRNGLSVQIGNQQSIENQ